MRGTEKSGWGLATQTAGSDRDALDRFAANRSLRIETFEISGIFLAMAQLGSGVRAVTASGSGYDVAAATAACIGEAAEYASGEWRPDDDAVRLAPDDTGHLKHIDPRSLLGFSDSQIARRERLNRAWCGFDRIPPPSALDSPAEWIVASNFDGTAEALCPAFLAFGGFGTRHGDATLDTDSNGRAAGPSLDDARMRGLLELVERDATGLWWHRGLMAPRLDRNDVTDPLLRDALERHRTETGRRLWFLKLPSVRQAEIMAAVSCEEDGTRTMFGFAAALEAAAATRGAFRELVQGEVALDAWEQRRAEGRPMTPEDRRMGKWLRRADIRQMRFAIGQGGAWPIGRVSSFDALLREISETFDEPWFVDLTRSDVGIPVAKAFVAGLAHFKPRLGVAGLSNPCLDVDATRPLTSTWSRSNLLV